MYDLNIFYYDRLVVNRKGSVVTVFGGSYGKDPRILRSTTAPSVGHARREFRRLCNVVSRWTWRPEQGEYNG